MSMTTLGMVGAGAGAVAAAGAVVGGGYLVWVAGSVIYALVTGDEDLKNVKEQHPRMFSCLLAIALVSSAILLCSSGYVSFLLAKAVWLKAGVPSLLVPVVVATVSGLIAMGSLKLAQKLTEKADDDAGQSRAEESQQNRKIAMGEFHETGEVER